MKEIQTKIYKKGNKLYTKNLNPGSKVYGEGLETFENVEYRNWQPSRSKAGAAVMNGIDLDIGPKDEILYLGAAAGTTVSHFSDITTEGFVYAVEYSETVIRELLELAEQRNNIAPILGDARKPGEYKDLITDNKVDIVFQDISQRDQPEIFLKNVNKFLKEDGVALLAIKARSISSSREPEEIFREVKDKIQQDLEIEAETKLDPYETEHLFIKCRK